MNKKATEWLKQADYDFGTARAMLSSARHIYCIFMCHLSLEKALKGLYLIIYKKDPPRTHSLVYLVELIKCELPDKVLTIIEFLDDISAPTRYPEDLDQLKKMYDKEKTGKIVQQTKKALQCLKKFYQP